MAKRSKKAKIGRLTGAGGMGFLEAPAAIRGYPRLVAEIVSILEGLQRDGAMETIKRVHRLVMRFIEEKPPIILTEKERKVLDTVCSSERVWYIADIVQATGIGNKKVGGIIRRLLAGGLFQRPPGLTSQGVCFTEAGMTESIRRTDF